MNKTSIKDFPSVPLTYALAFKAVGLEYDGGKKDFEITATSLISKSIRDIVKSALKIEKEEFSESIRIKAAIGSLIHGAVESKWSNLDKAKEILLEQGLDKDYVDNLDVKFENRSFKKINVNSNEYTISGKYDFVINNKVIDLKTTSTYVVETGIKNEDYRLQLSLYRWLNPEDITEDTGEIHAYFRDFRNISDTTRSKRSRPYPYSETEILEYQLHSIDYIDTYVKTLLQVVDFYAQLVLNKKLDIEEVPNEEQSELVFDFSNKTLFVQYSQEYSDLMKQIDPTIKLLEKIELKD